jgi:FkbM family methyltransferase
LVLDGGANEGQWLGYMRQFWPWVHVVCFEPLAECAAKIPRNPLTWVVQGALGAGCGEVEFHRSSFAQSSSMLAMGEAHKSLFPFSKDHDVVKVVMTTLDAFFDGMEGPDVVKLDLQGYELEALKGGERVLSGARALCVETSFVELYDGQPLFGEVHEWLRAKGWRYRGAIEAPMLSGEDGTPLEEDSWFSR